MATLFDFEEFKDLKEKAEVGLLCRKELEVAFWEVFGGLPWT